MGTAAILKGGSGETVHPRASVSDHRLQILIADRLDNVPTGIEHLNVAETGTRPLLRLIERVLATGFAAFRLPKPIGLKSNTRHSSVLVKVPSITSPDVSTYLRPG